MNQSDRSIRLSRLRATAMVAASLLMLKVLVETMYEYRWYFPVNFDESTFLMGRRATFLGAYRLAFFAHIISGPVVILLGSILMFLGPRPHLSQLHRPLGRIQMLLVLAVVVPSGLVMALQAYTGAVAAWGFGIHSLLTGITAVMAIRFAMARNIARHQRWATRCFILLCSPLLLRLISGATIVMQVDSDWTYRLTAWASWLIPIVLYEALRRSGDQRTSQPTLRQLPRTEKAFP